MRLTHSGITEGIFDFQYEKKTKIWLIYLQIGHGILDPYCHTLLEMKGYPLYKIYGGAPVVNKMDEKLRSVLSQRANFGLRIIR